MLRRVTSKCAVLCCFSFIG